MRKLKLQVQMTVDGYIAGINGEMDWTAQNWDGELKKYVGEITEPIDCIILDENLPKDLFLIGLHIQRKRVLINLTVQKKWFLPKRSKSQNGQYRFSER